MSSSADEASPMGRLNKHTRHVIRKAKARARTDIDDDEWGKFKYYRNPLATAAPAPCGFIAREHASSLSLEEFRAKYEAPCLPVVIAGAEEGWRAHRAWTPEVLYGRYRHYAMKCGEDDDGDPVKMDLKYFFRYMATQKDDSPLYIFHSSFEDDKHLRALVEDYQVPKYFPDDLFHLVGEKKRPPYRWFLIGPVRSGTTCHIDPLGTSAWNTLISGRKRWVLFPPSTNKDLAKGKAPGIKLKGEDDEAIDYFVNMVPRIKATGVPGVVEFVQEAGETVYVPGGWWHAVLNITDTIAVTQNFASVVNFPGVWRQTRTGRPGMAVKWREELRTRYPDLYRLSLEMDAADSFSLEAFREAKRKRKEEKKRAKAAAKAASKAAKAAKAERSGEKRPAPPPASVPAAKRASSSDTSSDSSDSSDTSSDSSDSSDSSAGEY